MQILIPVLIVGGIGLLAGIILSAASVFMAVPKDEKAEALLDVLPGANCGACGFSGCSGYAKAMSEGKAEPGLCSPGGDAAARACAEILGSGEVSVVKKYAVVRCLGSDDNADTRMVYEGMQSCAGAQLLGGLTDCRFGCMGLGDCLSVCEYGAIKICNGLAQIDKEKCVGCSKCAAACPRGMITLIPKKRQAVVLCQSCDKTRDTIDVCKVGCVGCGRCQRICPRKAIAVENGLARIDPELCVGCGRCFDECPRRVIRIETL